ncbi:DUF2083 domain-containing protein [Dactylosporangium roseum]|uniref:DUF2083 domain-containing protein n=1 Tax=Dactylosporangium roseum TaxID=47989 RepID=UPI0021B338F2|nr:DUF2083 domain-containing protein [Dactylosporangium roseum]
MESRLPRPRRNRGHHQPDHRGHRHPPRPLHRPEQSPPRTCLRHADRLVYSDGLTLDNSRTATPIGPGCRICERQDCAQRARPPAAGRLVVDENRRTVIPYAVDGR